MKLGARVKYIRNDNEEAIASGFYPPVGTLGTVIEIDEDSVVCVKWDNGTKNSGEWWADYKDLEEVEDTNSELVDKIASFFEVEENWRDLMGCWLEDGKPYGLRGLLHKAVKM